MYDESSGRLVIDDGWIVGQGEQIVCDERIIGADELSAKRELKDISLAGH